MRKVIYACDINTCSFVTENVSEIKKSRILEKEYDICPNCRKSLDDFVEKRLVASGHNPGTSELEQVIEAMKDLSMSTPIVDSITISPYDSPVYDSGTNNPWKFSGSIQFPQGNITTTIPVDTSGIEKIDPSKPVVSVTGNNTPTANGTVYTEESIKAAKNHGSSFAVDLDQYFTNSHKSDLSS